MPFEQVDVKRVYLPRSPMQVLLHYLYYVFRKWYTYRKELFQGLTLLENGVIIDTSFVPYEHIVSVSEKTMTLLAKEDQGKLVPCDNLIHIEFQKSLDTRAIESNLYYHLKYNVVSLDVLGYKTVKPNVGLVGPLEPKLPQTQ